MTPLRRDAFVWMVEHRANGYVAYTGLFEEEGRRPGPLTRVVTGIPERIGIHIGRG